MALKKCPRCELNYILDGGNLCVVCREEVHGRRSDDDDDDSILCSVCGEEAALSGQVMCRACLADFKKATASGTDDEDDTMPAVAEMESGAISELDELDEIEGADDTDDADEAGGLDNETMDDEEGEAEPLHEYAKAQ